ncbi:MAG: hypothetical protein KDB37_15780 [Ilumatobacter sp.]|nr:hypothetical protein [Ilumatobacter sp.]
MNVAKLPEPGERWQFRHWRQLSSARSGSGRGGVTVERVVEQGEHPSAASDTVVIFRYDSDGSTASLALHLFTGTYDHTPDLPPVPVVEVRPSRLLRVVPS